MRGMLRAAQIDIRNPPMPQRQQFFRRLAAVAFKVREGGEGVIHRFDPWPAAGECPLRLLHPFGLHQQRSDERHVLHADRAAMLDERRGALTDERHLVKADARMHT